MLHLSLLVTLERPAAEKCLPAIATIKGENNKKTLR